MKQMGHCVAGLMSGQYQSETPLPGLKIFAQERKEEMVVSPTPLALEDTKDNVGLEPAAESEDHGKAKPTGEGAVGSTLQALQSELKERPAAERGAKAGKRKPTKKA